VVEAVDVVDAVDVSPDDLTSTMDQLHALMGATWHELLVAVAVFDAAEAWRADGMSSMADWLIARYGLARVTAVEWVRLASSFSSMPMLSAAVAQGQLSADQARSVVRMARPETEADVVRDAVGRSAAELAVMARKPPTVDDARDDDRCRFLRWRASRDGRQLRLSGALPADDGAKVVAALSRAAEQAGPDPTTGLFDPFESRCADSLVELASSAIAADADPDRATVVVHVPPTWFELARAADDAALDTAVAAALDSGVPLAAETLRRLACDARVQLVGEGVDGSHSDVVQAVPWWLRRQVLQRDGGGCRWPGCRRTRGVHTHHIVWFSRGGRTVIENLVALCRRHHRAVHEGGWAIEGSPMPGGALTFVRPDGRALPNEPVPLRDDVQTWLRGRVPSLGAVPRLAFDSG
jgi:hypothetical protein